MAVDSLPVDPIDFAAVLWPSITFYDRQREIIYSVVHNDETFVPAGHMLGKDFVAAFISLWFFLSRVPCRVVTTSADYPQLEAVLWGEIRRFVQTSSFPLEAPAGPLVVNHLHIRKVINGTVDGLSYLVGRVSAKGEGMQGHHIAEIGDRIPRTLWIADEASGVDDAGYKAADTWARRKLVIGNPYPCTNFFRTGVKGGDLYAKHGSKRTDGSVRPVDSRRGTVETGDAGETRRGVSGDEGESTERHVSGSTGGGNGNGSGDSTVHPGTAGTGGSGIDAASSRSTGNGPDGRAESQVGGDRSTDSSRHGGQDTGGVGKRSERPSHPGRCYRRVIKITGEDSPNVKAGLLYRRYGREPLGEILIPGVLPWDDYLKRLETWDPVRICVGIKAEFWEGADALLYPPQWLNRAEDLHRTLVGMPRRGKALGVDPGEGVANTSWTVVDDLGLIEQVSMVTPDTAVIVGHTKALAETWHVPPEDIVFDRGGGGKQIADLLRSQGWNVRTVSFGESPTPELHRGMTPFGEKKERLELSRTYKTRRAEMYGILRDSLDPSLSPMGFAIPPQYVELRRQLSLIPLLRDGEGCLYLPPKSRKPGSSVKSLQDIIGRSPDEADSLVLAVYGLRRKVYRPKVGVMV
jgi:hypothetical protein